jgi:hypothetical protein
MVSRSLWSLDRVPRQARWLIVASLVLLLPGPTSVVVAQSFGGEAAAKTEIRSIPKDQIPFCSVLWGFFTLLDHFKETAPFIYEKRLRTIGIELGGPGRHAVDAAVDAATQVLAQPTTDSTLVGEAYEAFQMNALREQARALAEVYGGLLADLEDAGSDPELLRAYLETTIRPSASYSLEVPAGQDVATAMAASPAIAAQQGAEWQAEAAYRRGASNLTDEEQP